jgi:LmbE family N-acetylglucosaminyl deacetylase
VVSPEQLGVIRRAEALEAGEILGVGPGCIVQTALAHLRDTAAVVRVTQILEDILADFGPEEILVNTALDYHPDHRAANRIVRDVTARLCFSGPVHEYPIWYLYDGPWRRGRAYLAGRPSVDESEPEPKGGAASALRLLQEPIASLIRLHPTKVQCGRYLGAKRAAVAAYRSQTTNFTGEEEWTYLGQDFVSVFLQPQEIFFPVGPTRH